MCLNNIVFGYNCTIIYIFTFFVFLRCPIRRQLQIDQWKISIFWFAKNTHPEILSMDNLSIKGMIYLLQAFQYTKGSDYYKKRLSRDYRFLIFCEFDFRWLKIKHYRDRDESSIFLLNSVKFNQLKCEWS